MADHILAHQDGPPLVFAIIVLMGGACSKCGHGTRVTSARWAKCKACGQRMRRRTGEEVETLMRERDNGDG